MLMILVDQNYSAQTFGGYVPGNYMPLSQIAIPVRGLRVVCRPEISSNLIVCSRTSLLLSSSVIDKLFSSGLHFLTSSVEVRMATSAQMREIREGEADALDKQGRNRRGEEIWDKLPISHNDYLLYHSPHLIKLSNNTSKERVLNLYSKFDSCQQKGKIEERISLTKEIVKEINADLLIRQGIAVASFDVFVVSVEFRQLLLDAGETLEGYRIVQL